MMPITGLRKRRFQFELDTFAFPNELVWEYRFDPVTGAMKPQRNEPPPTYAHHCFVMVRSARQFFSHARFDPAKPVADEATYATLVRQVVARNPRATSPDAERILVPGYDCLRSFSAAHPKVLKTNCGGAWQSYVLRSHWRMIIPIWRSHQQRLARQLTEAFAAGRVPIVHLVRFPQLTINHGIVLYEVLETESGLRFTAYDPNQPEAPTELTYTARDRTFRFPQNHYWPGGRVDVVEVYRGWIY